MPVKNNTSKPPQKPPPPKNDPPKKDPPKNDSKKDQPKNDPKKPPQPENFYNRPDDPKSKSKDKDKDKDKAKEKDQDKKKDDKKDDKAEEKKKDDKKGGDAAPADAGAPGGEAAPAADGGAPASGGDGPASAGPTSYISPDGTLTINPGDVMTLEMAEQIARESGGAYVVKDGALVNVKNPSDMKPIGQPISEGDIHDLHHNVIGAGGGGNSLNPSGVPDASKAGSAPPGGHANH